MGLMIESFDTSVEMVATKTIDVIHDIYDALDHRMSEAREELETKEESVLVAVRNMKHQLSILKKKHQKIVAEEIPYLTFQLTQAKSETNESASQTLLVSKIKVAKKKSDDIETKMKWMRARIRKLSKAPNLVRLYLGELQEEMVIVQNAIKINTYLQENNIRFGDLRASDLDKMFYSLRGKGEL